MKKTLMAAAALVALPVMAQAQTPSSGVYIGAEGGLNWMLNTTVTGQQTTPVDSWSGRRLAADRLGCGV